MAEREAMKARLVLVTAGAEFWWVPVGAAVALLSERVPSRREPRVVFYAPQEVYCSICKAARGEPCRTYTGKKRMPHTIRRMAARGVRINEGEAP